MQKVVNHKICPLYQLALNENLFSALVKGCPYILTHYDYQSWEKGKIGR